MSVSGSPYSRCDLYPSRNGVKGHSVMCTFKAVNGVVSHTHQANNLLHAHYFFSIVWPPCKNCIILCTEHEHNIHKVYILAIHILLEVLVSPVAPPATIRSPDGMTAQHGATIPTGNCPHTLHCLVSWS